MSSVSYYLDRQSQYFSEERSFLGLNEIMYGSLLKALTGYRNKASLTISGILPSLKTWEYFVILDIFMQHNSECI